MDAARALIAGGAVRTAMPAGAVIARACWLDTLLSPGISGAIFRRSVVAVEEWVAHLKEGRPDPAWDAFLARYRRLIFAAIRHYARDYDDVMDVFARICEALREDDLRRLRGYVDEPEHRARFSTWLVTVIRHITVDWF